MFLLRNSRIGNQQQRRGWNGGISVYASIHGASSSVLADRQVRYGSNGSAVVHHGTRVLGVPPTKAKVVVCGGGVMGAAVAYYLGLSGWGEDTVLIEQQQ